MCFQKGISLQGTANDISSYIHKRQGPKNLIKLVQRSELQAVMENNKALLRPSVQLAYQPYEITSANIKYIDDNLNPVCLLSTESEVSSTADALATGMSFHTSERVKARLVVFTCFKVSTCSDFEVHFKAHMKYVTQKVVSSLDENFHIFVLFPIHMRFGEVSQIAFKCGLKPGIRDEGIVLTHSSIKTYKPANL